MLSDDLKMQGAPMGDDAPETEKTDAAPAEGSEDSEE
jgi:hypothetical protein